MMTTAVGRQYCRESPIGKGVDTMGRSAMAFLKTIGHLGQLLGLGIPVLAVLLQLNDRIRSSQMLVMLVASVCCFWIGRILEGYARR